VESVTKYKILLLIVAIGSCSQSTSEKKVDTLLDLVGVWQAERYDEADAWPDTYQFFTDGKFVFNFSQYDGSKRILRIHGRYLTSNDSVFLNIESTVEAVGGYLTRSTITSLSDTWELTDYSVQTIKQSKREPEIIKVRQCQTTYPKECLLFDGRKYFRMDKDPTKYN
jgi:hypothetical protein